MRRVCKVVVVVLVMSALLLSASRTALADPVNGANAASFTLTCGNQTITVVTPSANAAIAQVIGTTSVGVATEVNVSLTFIDPDTGQPVTTTQTVIYGAGHGKAQGLQNRLTTCSSTFTFEDPEVGTVTVTLSVTQFLTPPR